KMIDCQLTPQAMLDLFFQAEDGIRDRNVTGVQTCALPISMAATLLVEQFQPTHILFTGIAGGLNPDLRPGDVVIGAKTAYHDYGEWTPDGFRVGRTVDPFTGKPNPLFFPADAGLLAVAEKAALDLKLAPVK